MHIEPVIKQMPVKKLVGMHNNMSLVQNKTAELWRSFMPHRHHIQHKVNTDFISLQIYPPTYFEQFNPAQVFEKWACLEVNSFDDLPEELATLTIDEGLFAVFHYKGLSTDTSIFQYIYGTWLPSSLYALNDGPHFEVLGGKYKNNVPDSEEEIWIPIKFK